MLSLTQLDQLVAVQYCYSEVPGTFVASLPYADVWRFGRAILASSLDAMILTPPADQSRRKSELGYILNSTLQAFQFGTPG